MHKGLYPCTPFARLWKSCYKALWKAPVFRSNRPEGRGLQFGSVATPRKGCPALRAEMEHDHVTWLKGLPAQLLTHCPEGAEPNPGDQTQPQHQSCQPHNGHDHLRAVLYCRSSKLFIP